MLIHSWTDAGSSLVNPMIWPDRTLSPEAAANDVIPKLKAKSYGNKVLLMQHTMLIDSNKSALDIPASDDDIIKGYNSGPDYTVPASWYFEFYTRILKAGINLDFIACDEEQGWSYWQIPQLQNETTKVPFLKNLYSNGNISARMKEFLPENYNHSAILAYNNWAGHITGKALKKSIYDTALLVFGGANCSNFGDNMPSFQLYDSNGWEIEYDAFRVKNEASPGVYLQAGNRHINRSKHPVWNAFIDCINEIKSPANLTNNLSPWISYPSFNYQSTNLNAQRWLWTELVKHFYSIADSIALFWNPVESALPDDNAFAVKVFKECLSIIPAPRGGYLEAPMDADNIITLDVVTNYSDFAKLL